MSGQDRSAATFCECSSETPASYIGGAPGGVYCDECDKPVRPVDSAARTTYRVSSFTEIGFPRWGTKKLWRVDAGPPYYKEVAGPFTSHREALDALAELVNAAFPSKVMTGGDDG